MKNQYYHGQKHKNIFTDKEYTVVMQSPDLAELSTHTSCVLSGIRPDRNLMVNVGLALVHTKDNYSRKIGRETAIAAMRPIQFTLRQVHIKEEGRIHFILVATESKLGSLVLEYRRGKNDLHLIEAFLRDSFEFVSL